MDYIVHVVTGLDMLSDFHFPMCITELLDHTAETNIKF